MPSTGQEMLAFVKAIEKKVRAELRSRCEALEVDTKCPETFSVVTALMARQATLAIELASAPTLWNGHSAPLFLRAMTDLHITLAWILKEDSCTRAKQYIQHGLGQASLTIEHKKSELGKEDEEGKRALQEIIENETNWINMQRWSFLVEVNVGSWSGKSTREMAKEANIMGFYNHVYTPFSQCAHSTWYHVGRYNSAPSASPLTRPVWEAGINESPIDFGHMDLAAKYLDKTFNEFDSKALRKEPSSKIRDWIGDQINVHLSSDAGEMETDMPSGESD